MKKFIITVIAVLAVLPAFSQSCYWVFLTDKQGTTFDPYTYFDAKAIERYNQCGADLYDISNYPLNSSYVSQIDAIASEEVGTSRWLNAVAVMATPEQMSRIEQLPFVKGTHQIASEMQIAAYKANSENSENSEYSEFSEFSQSPETQLLLNDQLIRMGGLEFAKQGIDGKGVRIAVFDGGFPKVNTHQAFKHLFDNHQIIKTWNFCNDKEDVYGWNSHGTMTLSCIAGISYGTKKMGLATGAEFLLARTEVDLEPFKEEVWWMQAVEWADKNGAQIISSSLGYGKERYDMWQMDGTSYVAKAGNMAARKGILVCNSAGNEATTSAWKTIITPADADSVLCVGGIEADLKHYRHISFSSFGPSATGTLKPNVCAYGHAFAAQPSGNDKYGQVDGTSFSCPLVAGFAACALQACPGLTAMQLFHEIEKSADLYPYFDYAFGYGVPQASYFCNKRQHTVARPTFRFVEKDDVVELHFLNPVLPTEISRPLFCNVQNEQGTLDAYRQIEINNMDTASYITFDKKQLYRRTLNVWFDGYTASFRLTDEQNKRLTVTGYSTDFSYQMKPAMFDNFSYSPMLSKQWKKGDWSDINTFGNSAKWRGDFYIQLGDVIRLSSQEYEIGPWSPVSRIGVRVMRALAKPYCIGLGLEYGNTRYTFDPERSHRFDNLFTLPTASVDHKYYYVDEVTLELFQRVRFVPGGLFGKGLHWDLGAYASRCWYSYQVAYKNIPHAAKGEVEIKDPQYQDNYKFNFGLTTRFSYDAYGIFFRYRLTGFATNYDAYPDGPTAFKLNLPRFEAGLQLCF